MSITTIKISGEVRDKLAEVAQRDFGGSTLGESVDRLLAEHERARLERAILDGYARLQADPAAWAGYVSELDEWDQTSGDGLHGDRA